MIVDEKDADACEERRRRVQSSSTRVRPWPIFNARERAAGRPVSRDEPPERGDGSGHD
jgi:hypothetical protein